MRQLWFFLVVLVGATAFMVELIFAQSTTTSTIFLSPGPRSRVRVGYGEICNKTVRCKSGAWISCDLEEGRCQCVKPEDMIFDTRRQKCVALIGERCKFGIAGAEESDTEATEDDGTGNSKWFEITDCVDGGVCNLEGVCQCPPKFYEDIEANNCSVSRGHGSPCKSQVECDSTQMLACLEGTCQCFSPNDMEFNTITRICDIKVGRNCKNLHAQFQNSTPLIPVLHGTPGENNDEVAWLRMISSFSAIKCHRASSCSDSTGLCSCPPDQYIDYENAACVPVKGVGSICRKAEECNSTQFLTCLNNGRCVCDPDIAVANKQKFVITNIRDRRGRNSNFEVPSETCVKKVGHFCSVDGHYPNSHNYYETYIPRSDNVYCIEDAECVSNSCRCKTDFEPTKDGMCGREYGHRCSSSNPCSDRFLCTSVIDESSAFIVKRCRCPNENSQIFDLEPYVASGVRLKGSCRGLIGTPCDPKSSDSRSCVHNADCVLQENGQFICECRGGFVENFKQKCDIEYGSPCKYENRNDVLCDQEAGLYCKIVPGQGSSEMAQFNEICQCPDFTDVYEADKRQCTKPVGYACNETLTCVAHAACVKNGIRKKGRCKCEEGFVPTVRKSSHNFAICIPSATQLNLNSDVQPVIEGVPSTTFGPDLGQDKTTTEIQLVIKETTNRVTSSEEQSLETDVDHS